MSDLYELSISRFIKASPETVWRAWTRHATEWFTPRPWSTVSVDHDLRPGGRADVVMFSELFLSAYPPEDLVLKPAFQDACRAACDVFAHTVAEIAAQPLAY